MSPRDQLQSLINALITDGALTDVQRSIVLSHADLQGIPEAEALRMIEDALAPSRPDTPYSDVRTQADAGAPADDAARRFGSGPSFKDAEPLGPARGFTLIQKARLDGRWVVVKRLPALYKYNAGYAQHLWDEYQRGRDLQHPHIVAVYGQGEDADGPFYYREYVDGLPLSQRLNANGLDDKRLVPQIAVELLDALAYAHKRQAYHQDLSPEQIFITGQGGHVKVKGFGNATGLAGTAGHEAARAYAAPESRWAAGSPPDGRADLYAYGVILLEMLTGSHDPADVKQLPAGAWREVAARCLQPNPADRYATADEPLEIIRGQAGSTAPPPVAAPAQAPRRPAAPVGEAAGQVSPAVPFPPGGQQKLPHDVAVLVLGLLAVVGCGCNVVFGVIALVLANQSEAAYTANPTAYRANSRQLVQIGKVCAIIGLVLGAISWFGWFAGLFD